LAGHPRLRRVTRCSAHAARTASLRVRAFGFGAFRGGTVRGARYTRYTCGRAAARHAYGRDVILQSPTRATPTPHAPHHGARGTRGWTERTSTPGAPEGRHRSGQSAPQPRAVTVAAISCSPAERRRTATARGTRDVVARVVTLSGCFQHVGPRAKRAAPSAASVCGARDVGTPSMRSRSIVHCGFSAPPPHVSTRRSSDAPSCLSAA